MDVVLLTPSSSWVTVDSRVATVLTSEPVAVRLKVAPSSVRVKPDSTAPPRPVLSPTALQELFHGKGERAVGQAAQAAQAAGTWFGISSLASFAGHPDRAVNYLPCDRLGLTSLKDHVDKGADVASSLKHWFITMPDQSMEWSTVEAIRAG